VLQDTAGNDVQSISNRLVLNGSTALVTQIQGNLVQGTNVSEALVGGSGKDVLIGGPGNDTLTGGLGSNTFVFDQTADGTAWDTVTDFDPTKDLIRMLNFQGLQ
jgi:Ca2+-binding RTX toxin-like protein